MTTERFAHKDPKLAAGPSCADEAAWLAGLITLAPGQAGTLLAALRTLYPHDALPDPVYRRAVAALDRIGASSSPIAGLLRDFVATVDAAMPLPFARRSESFRVSALKAIEHTPAFVFVQRAGVRHLYDDIEIWEAFGYEGASYHLGGYVDRGFDDLDWLPPIPADGEGAAT